jgi:hypothetical protein
MSEEEIAQVESLIGDRLQETGYEVVTPAERRRTGFAARLMGLIYPIYFDAKLWLKTYTPLAKTADLGRMGISKASSPEVAS